VVRNTAAFRKDRELVWGWYEWRRMKVLRAQPNPAHMAIAALAKLVPELTIITQNVDDLLERAGCTDVLHLHGSRIRHAAPFVVKPTCFRPASLTNPMAVVG
jgi:NAD-dependent SIR2 family protein deacetylase